MYPCHISEKLLPQLLWPERTLKMNVSPSPAGYLFFDRLEKFVLKKKLDRNFQISDFKIFRFQISKILLLKCNFFQKFWKTGENEKSYISTVIFLKSEIWKFWNLKNDFRSNFFRSNFFLKTNFSNRSKNKWPAGNGDTFILRVLSGQSNWWRSFSEIWHGYKIGTYFLSIKKKQNYILL